MLLNCSSIVGLVKQFCRQLKIQLIRCTEGMALDLKKTSVGKGPRLCKGNMCLYIERPDFVAHGMTQVHSHVSQHESYHVRDAIQGKELMQRQGNYESMRQYLAEQVGQQAKKHSIGI